MLDDSSKSSKQDFNILSFSVTNGLVFLTSSILAKLGSLAILFSDGDGLGAGSLFIKTYLVFIQDVVVSIIFFLSLYAVLNVLRASSRLLVYASWLVYAFQFIYLVYVVSYIEYFRLFKTQLSLSFVTAFMELYTTPESTLSESFASGSITTLVKTFLVYYIILFHVWPRLKALKVKQYLSVKSSAFTLLLFFVFINVYAAASLTDDYPVISQYSLDENPFLGFVLSVYNTLAFYFETQDYIPYELISESQNTLLIDPDYPLMRGTEYAVCSHPKLSKSPEFRQMCGLDEDADGYTKTFDCNDGDQLIHPGALEIKHNGVDENCNIHDNPPLNVILIILESINSENMQLYGGPVENTPNLLAYEDKSFIAHNFYPNAGTSFRADFTTFCSIYPYGNYWNLNRPEYQLMPCISDILKANGYRNGYFTPSNALFGGNREFILSKGSWDKLIEKKHFRDVSGEYFLRGHWGIIEETALLEPFFRWVDSDYEKPFFAVLRCSTGHGAGKDISLRGEETYMVFDDDKLNAILYIDSFIGDVLAALGDRGLMEETLVVVVGDHRVQSRLQPGRIPFIMINPILFEGGVHSYMPSSHIDVTPTILDILKVQSINSFVGESIFQIEDEKRRIFFTAIKGRKAIIERDFLYDFRVNSGRKRLYLNGSDITSDSESLVEDLHNDLIHRMGEYDRLYSINKLFRKDLLY